MMKPRAAQHLTSLLRWFFHHLYTTIAWAYDAVAWLSSLGEWAAWRRTALDRLPRAGRCLELGFGTGHLLVEAEAAGLGAFGADESRQMARLTRRRLGRSRLPVRIVRARAQALPFAARTFSAVFATFPSEYIFDPASLAEIRRLLAPPGIVIVVFSSRIRPRFPWQHLTRWLYESSAQAPAADPTWLAPFAEAGFEARFDTVDVPGASVIQIVARLR
jgi:ubiquinone/menaquinone biosynthesis C-methylase UbiE